MLNALLSRLPMPKHRVRSLYNALRRRYVNAFHTYDEVQLLATLRSLGIREGDTLMVHAGFDRFSGFKASPSRLIDMLFHAVGANGNLLMVSMAYMSSAYDYLKQGKPFDVRKTVSHMGLVSETFRRRQGVLRSLHPSNPVLAAGPKAQWIVEGHEACLQPCGPGSPFDKIGQLHAKVLFYDASIYTQTFFHYLEDSLETRLPFPLFRDGFVAATVIDYAGDIRVIQTKTYSEEAIRRRRPQIMTRELDRLGLIARARIGNSRLILLATDDVICVVNDMASRGVFFYS